MAWIKRNLFFAIGGAIALLLLGGASFYNFQGWSHNSAAMDKLNEIYGTLKQLNDQKPAPGDTKINNTQTAKNQEREIRGWVELPNLLKLVPSLLKCGCDAAEGNVILRTTEALYIAICPGKKPRLVLGVEPSITLTRLGFP